MSIESEGRIFIQFGFLWEKFDGYRGKSYLQKKFLVFEEEESLFLAMAFIKG
jgi:hypothetical protein